MTPIVLAAAVPVITGLVEVILKTGLNTKWAPLLTLVLGFGVVFLFIPVWGLNTVLIGLVTGLAANGLNEQITTTPAAIASIFKKSPSA